MSAKLKLGIMILWIATGVILLVGGMASHWTVPLAGFLLLIGYIWVGKNWLS